jgi:vacuolar-type H+-ATPase subunit I/STV1
MEFTIAVPAVTGVILVTKPDFIFLTAQTQMQEVPFQAFLLAILLGFVTMSYSFFHGFYPHVLETFRVRL